MDGRCGALADCRHVDFAPNGIVGNDLPSHEWGVDPALSGQPGQVAWRLVLHKQHWCCDWCSLRRFYLATLGWFTWRHGGCSSSELRRGGAGHVVGT